MPPTMSDDATGSTTIDIRRTDVENLVSRFDVRLRDGDGSATEHVVTVSRAEWERFGTGYRTPEELVEASFRFLLDRETKEQILRSFGLGQIGQYFPSYEREIEPES